MTDNKVTEVTEVPVAAPVGDATAQLTIHDVFQLVKFLENLAQMNRLSQIEVEGIRPAFENVAGFIRHYEAQVAAQQAASTVVETSNEELNLADVKPKKKKGKK